MFKAVKWLAFHTLLVWRPARGNPLEFPDENYPSKTRGIGLCQVADVEARQRLRSSSSSSLIVSHTRLFTVGDRAFPVAAARVWNSLPDLVTSTPSVAVFRSRLKTHLFNIFLTPVIVQCLWLKRHITQNFTLQTTPWENAKLKCSEISTLQNRQIKMQLKYSVLQYALSVSY